MDARERAHAGTPGRRPRAVRESWTLNARGLSFHARYRCGRSGRCCSSGWPIPVEAGTLGALESSLASGTLKLHAIRDPARAFIRPAGAPEETPALVGTNAGRCVFLDSSRIPACEIQRSLGHPALPLACRQFPRVSVVDPRGVSVTLSNYCPTAAGLLDAAGPTTIVVSPEAFPDAGEYVGLDAARNLPPLLKPDLLMDWASWWEWEAESVDLIANAAEPVARRLARLHAAVSLTRTWTPDAGPLGSRIRQAFDTARRNPAPRRRIDVDARVREVRDGVPEWTHVPAAPGERPLPDAALGRFLAAHAFGNWTAHLGRGLRTWLCSIEAAYAMVLATGSAGDTDLVLRHLADPHALARLWSAAEARED